MDRASKAKAAVAIPVAVGAIGVAAYALHQTAENTDRPHAAKLRHEAPTELGNIDFETPQNLATPIYPTATTPVVAPQLPDRPPARATMIASGLIRFLKPPR